MRKASRKATSRSPALLLLALVPLAWCAVAISGCANPTTAYHRQFEYLRRMGDEALAEGRLEDAQKHLNEAASLAQIAAATDLEFIVVLTKFSEAARETGALDEARGRLQTAARVLARYRLSEGRAERHLRRVGGSYALERARLEAERGDFATSEAAALEFFDLRGDGGDEVEATTARGLLGELLMARGLVAEAQTEFRAAEEGASELDAASGGRLLFRVAEAELEQGRVDRATALVDTTRPDGVGLAALRPGMLLVLARVDVAERNLERAGVRLEEALELLASDDPAIRQDPASPARALFVASLLFDAKQSHAKLIAHAERIVELAKPARPLARLHLGNELIDTGRDLLAAGRSREGAQMIEDGRYLLEGALRGRAHIALVRADFEMATALAAAGLSTLASDRCQVLLEMSKKLEEIEREERVERLIACGRIDAARRDVARARKHFLDALYSGEAPLPAELRLELLVRLAAISHFEDGATAEVKFFERILPLAGGSFDRLEALLLDAYGPLGSVAPSSAAARIAHTAARSSQWHSSAPELQAMAEKLGGEDPGAAKRRP